MWLITPKALTVGLDKRGIIVMIEYCAPMVFGHKKRYKTAFFMVYPLHKASIFEQGGAYNNLVWIFIKFFSHRQN